MPAVRRPVGTVTRGTTNPNRLRRVDRYLAGVLGRRLRDASAAPVVVDLGYGASPVTTVEMAERLRAVRADARVVGIEIDRERVAAAVSLERDGLVFVHGGFEVPLPAGWPAPTIIRALNVLRQYDEAEVSEAWALLASRLAPGGVLVDGTCDELGRRAAWVCVESGGPVSLTTSVRLGSIERPSDVAERLPKALIHRNVPGEPVHGWLAALDRAWDVAAPLASLGVRQRWLATVGAVKAAGWPVLDGPSRWRLGEVSVPWACVAPTAGTGPRSTS